MTEKELAKLFVKENFSCYNIDCEKCKETNFLHQCLQNDVQVYCKEILGRGYKDRRIDALKNENREQKKEIGRLGAIIEKMKNCRNCEHYETVEDYGSCRAKCVKNKNGQWILTNWELYKD